MLQGREAIRAALTGQDARLIVVDCIRDADLIEIGAAAADEPLITGGSGIALGLPLVYRERGEIGTTGVPWIRVDGPAVVLSGSCSVATRAQVDYHKGPKLEVTAGAVIDGSMTAERAAHWVLVQHGLPLVYSSAEPKVVRAAQDRYGREHVTGALERFMACTALQLAEAGVRRLIVAGGETSGAVTEALGVTGMEIGPEIDPGVPALRVVDRPLALALKSGNFGAQDFFVRAAEILGNP